MPCTRCSDARRFVPASVSASVPFSNLKVASVMRPGGFLRRREPHETPGDHQVDDQEEVVVKREHDALVQPPHVADRFADRRVDPRNRRAQHERIAQVDRDDALAGDTRGERLAIDLEIRQFGHRVAALPRSIRLDMEAALGQQLRLQRVPIETVIATDVAERLDDARLHALQAAEVDVAVVVLQHLRHLLGALANPVLHVALRLPSTRENAKLMSIRSFGSFISGPKYGSSSARARRRTAPSRHLR
jgi:hypothetical protein